MGSMRKWRRHSLEFKKQVVERMKTCGNITGLAAELGLERKLLYIWLQQLEGRPPARHADYQVTAEERKEIQLTGQVNKLKAALADKVLENDFLKSALLRVKEGRQPNCEAGDSASTPTFGRGSKSKAV